MDAESADRIAAALERVAETLPKLVAELGKMNDAVDEIASCAAASDRRQRWPR